MKRTITEIIVEVEETLLVRETGKTAGDLEEAPPAEEIMICPSCGQAIYQTKNLSKGEEK